MNSRKGLTVLCALILTGCASTEASKRQPVAETVAQKDSTVAALNQTQADIVPITKLQEAADFVATLPSGSRTLVVFDIDDTLLTTPTIGSKDRQFFGSDRWYLWQTDKSLPDIAKGTDIVPCLFDVIAMNYEVGTQVATEPDAPQTAASIGFDKIVLTSRSADYRDATERELVNAKFSLPVFPSIGGPAGGMGFHSPASKSYVTYINGIYMTKGGNKGTMLLELLERIDPKKVYENVVLVDDSQNKLVDMQTALASTQTKFFGLRYQGVKPFPVPAVTADELKDARESWGKWKLFMSDLYPDRKKRLENKNAKCEEKAYAL